MSYLPSSSAESCLTTHILDLPPQVLYRVFVEMDYLTINNMGETCTYLKQMVQNFRQTHSEIWKSKFKASSRAGVDDDTDDDDYYDYYDPPSNSCSGDDEVGKYYDELLDNLSFGSNYDEEVEDFLANDGNSG